MLALFALSVLAAAGGVMAYRGRWRKWFGWRRAGVGYWGLALLYTGSGGTLFASMAFYAFLPQGGLEGLRQQGGTLLFAVHFLGGLALVLLGFGFAMWGMPEFLKPAWVRELEGTMPVRGGTSGRAPTGADRPAVGLARAGQPLRLSEGGLALLGDLPYGGLRHQLARAPGSDVEALVQSGLLDRQAGLTAAGIEFTAPLRSRAASVEVARTTVQGDAMVTYRIGPSHTLRIEAVPAPGSAVSYDIRSMGVEGISRDIEGYVAGAGRWLLRSRQQHYEAAFDGWGDAQRHQVAAVVEAAGKRAGASPRNVA
ncbi:hypothetical protein D477_004334 [Arthrobacter crystallopoietes BAB-32]|uniref:Uncharacterized protein n=2 Tax=Crystallibacter crystallopoietes TaxID=37928 RepID=N1V5Z6_9MICC|nr:hypothetical protein D477_004334 [Arthrobacter crystallopoietes BAB-32]